METFGNILETKKGQKGQPVFLCEKCDFICSKKYNWERHILTSKHLMETNGNQKGQKKGKKSKMEEAAPFQCETCNMTYNNRSGLWKHKQKCSCSLTDLTDIKQHTTLDKDDLIIEILKQNKELLEIVKNGTTSHSHNTTNSHNKAFNLQFFLNETCKNAMNITDFVDSIKLQLTDLMEVGELGYVEGISNIIVKNLNNLDETERPIHCTDKKRETFYVKDQGQWEKEDQERNKIRKIIKNVAFKNERLL
jgi:protein-arginine kinase activator protein McsA